MKTSLIVLLTGIIFNLQIIGQTHIPAGYINGTWYSSGSPYIIDGEITIDTGDLLVIEPGVDVEFSGHYQFIIRGRLLAEGTLTDSIHFYPQDTISGWHGLFFKLTNINGQDSSQIKFTSFKYGKAYGSNSFDKVGGAIRCSAADKLLIDNCLIKSNEAVDAGAIYLLQSDIRIKNTIIENNYAIGLGGGVWIQSSEPVLSNVILQNNEADAGGAIYITPENSSAISELKLINVNISNNQANQNGGGISIASRIVNLFFTNVNIAMNSASYHGGGISGCFNMVDANNVKIFGNNADQGGGLSVSNSDTICNLLIFGNYANFGGGMDILSDNPVFIEKVTITNNYAILGGSGLHCYDTCTVSIKNSIIWNNSGSEEIVLEDVSVCNASFCDIEQNDSQTIWPGPGNINANPLFADTTSNDYQLRWPSYPLPDESKSPCINMGDPLSDPDPDGSRADMGAIPFNYLYIEFTSLPGGDVSGTLSCSESPYYVYGNLTVPTGEVLIIEPCVYVIFQGDYRLTVNGRLLAEGTTANKISFYSADTSTGWQGIRFENQNINGQDTSKLLFCRVLYGNADGYSFDAYGGGLYLSNSSDVLVKNCVIERNKSTEGGGGIFCNDNSHPVLIDNLIRYNVARTGGGIYGYSSRYFIEGGYIEFNTAEYGAGIYQYGNTPQFTALTIRKNFATKFGGAIYFYANTNPVFSSTDRCNIYDNYAVIAGTDLCGIDLPSGATMTIYADTFTVMNVDDHFIYPMSKFILDHLHGKNPQYDVDLYVSNSGDDSNSGTSASDPLKTIYRALMTIDPVSASPDPLTIYLDNASYSNSLTGEKFPLNWRANVNLECNTGSDCILDGENSTNFFYFYDDQNCFLTNVKMQNGYADYGGAMNLDKNSVPHIFLCEITQCRAENEGGGIYCYESSSPYIIWSYFEYNEAGTGGGAIACRSGSSPYINGVNFVNNSALYAGGAIYASLNCNFQLGHCGFYNNSANDGGACSINYNSDPDFYEVTFSGNHAVMGQGGAIYFWYLCDPVLQNCRLTGNTATNGGGAISFYQSINCTLSNVLISGNTAAFGGGIYGNLWSSLNLRNVQLTSNYAAGNPYTDDHGGAIYLWDVETEVINTTLSHNLAEGDGGAIYNKAGDISIFNSILWSDSPGEIYLESGSATAEYSDIEGGWTGSGNLNLNPEFYDPLTSDYSLDITSPCIDMGTPDTTGLNLPLIDLAGNPRIGNNRVDMGGYEYYERMELDLTVFLEGPFNGTDMNTDLNDLVDFPLIQPYFLPPWEYMGNEEVTYVTGTNIVDWILIELRDAPDASSAVGSTMFFRMAGLLLSNGSVVGADKISNPLFYNVLTNQLFVVIWHRNHLGIISAYPLTETGGIYSYDFTTGSDQAYNNGQKEIAPEIWGMFAGDADASGLIDGTDKTYHWQLQAGKTGYSSGDLNLDTQIDNQDKNDLWIKNFGENTMVPD